METFQADTSARTVRQWAVGLAVLLAGLVVAHFGVTLFLLSGLGSDPFTVLVQGISALTDLGIGTCHVGILVLLLIVMLIFTRGYVKPGSFVCAFCGGWIIDFFLWIFSGKINENSPLWLRILCMVAGCVILAFGMSVVSASRSGTGPNDLVAVSISELSKKPFGVVRVCVDVAFALVGWLLGGVLGVGTVVCAFLVGPVAQFCFPLSRRLCARGLTRAGINPESTFAEDI